MEYRQGDVRDQDALREAFKDAQGRVEYLTGACMDITEIRATEAELRDSEERYRLAVEAMQGSIYEFDVLTSQPNGALLAGSHHGGQLARFAG